MRIPRGFEDHHIITVLLGWEIPTFDDPAARLQHNVKEQFIYLILDCSDQESPIGWLASLYKSSHNVTMNTSFVDQPREKCMSAEVFWKPSLAR